MHHDFVLDSVRKFSWWFNLGLFLCLPAGQVGCSAFMAWLIIGWGNSSKWVSHHPVAIPGLFPSWWQISRMERKQAPVLNCYSSLCLWNISYHPTLVRASHMAKYKVCVGWSFARGIDTESHGDRNKLVAIISPVYHNRVLWGHTWVCLSVYLYLSVCLSINRINKINRIND